MDVTDQFGKEFGTQGNPLATNQVVGTPVYSPPATSTTGGQCVATLPADTTGKKTTYLNGFFASFDSSTAKSVFVTISFDGGVTTHMSFLLASSSSVPGEVSPPFPDPIPATKPGTTIVVTVPAPGGATQSVSCQAWGYQL